MERSSKPLLAKFLRLKIKMWKKALFEVTLGFFFEKKVDLLPKPQKWSHKWLFDIINILVTEQHSMWVLKQFGRPPNPVLSHFLRLKLENGRKITYNITFVGFFLGKKNGSFTKTPKKWNHKWLFDPINLFTVRTTPKVSPD